MVMQAKTGALRKVTSYAFLLVILGLCIWIGCVITKSTQLDAQQLSKKASITCLLWSWVYPLLLFGISWLMRKSIFKMVIMLVSMTMILLLSRQGYANLVDEMPFATMGPDWMEAGMLIFLTIPFLVIAHGLETLMEKSNNPKSSAPKKVDGRGDGHRPPLH